MLNDLEWLAHIWVNFLFPPCKGLAEKLNVVSRRARRFVKRLRMARSHLG